MKAGATITAEGSSSTQAIKQHFFLLPSSFFLLFALTGCFSRPAWMNDPAFPLFHPGRRTHLADESPGRTAF
jgi:hypothetical protein